MSINDIIEEALTLKSKDRCKIIDTLMSSLSKANDDLSHLEKELDKGLTSKLSTKSRKEVFQKI